MNLVSLVQPFPVPLLRAAMRERPLVHDDLNNPVVLLDLAERLSYLAGLAIAALYIDDLVRGNGAVDKDAFVESWIKSMLFGRGYDQGISRSLLQQAASMHSGRFRNLIPEDPEGLSLLDNRLHGMGNLFRARAKVTSWASRVFRQLCFLQRFQFMKGTQMVRFDGTALDVYPFIQWDGRRVSWFLRPSAWPITELAFQFAEEGAEISRTIALEEKQRDRLRAIWDWVHCNDDSDPFSALPDQNPEPFTQSIIPMFADSYPLMHDMATRIFKSADQHTCEDLWVSGSISDPNEAKRKSLDAIYVTNAIIKQCMEYDPVLVFEQYFLREMGDRTLWLRELLKGNQEAIEAIDRDLEKIISEYAHDIKLFYSIEPSQHVNPELAQQLNFFKARVYAQKVVELLGFPIHHQDWSPDLVDYEHRFLKLHDRVIAGTMDYLHALRACAVTAERILSLILKFYTALKHYDRSVADGIKPGDVRPVGRQKKVSLGTLVDEVYALNRDPETLAAIHEHLGRERLWFGKSQAKHFEYLKLIAQTRNAEFHYNVGERRELGIKPFLNFLQWLGDGGGISQNRWRIYPAVLSLDLVSVNRCGITSIKYMLRSADSFSEGARKPITLYTRQPLKLNAGSFFGIPHLGRVHENLWVDPLLISTSIFSG